MHNGYSGPFLADRKLSIEYLGVGRGRVSRLGVPLLVLQLYDLGILHVSPLFSCQSNHFGSFSPYCRVLRELNNMCRFQECFACAKADAVSTS